jgi:hypothetical protein
MFSNYKTFLVPQTSLKIHNCTHPDFVRYIQIRYIRARYNEGLLHSGFYLGRER